MRLAWLKIIAFIAIVAAPGALLALGEVAPYGRGHPDFPKLEQLLHGQRGALDALGEALLHRSSATRAAITLRNSIGFSALRTIDLPQMISGREHFLYYREDFQEACASLPHLYSATARVGAVMDFADAAALRLTVSVSPDKSTMYPEYLPSWGEHYWWCKRRSVPDLRRHLATNAPRVIDHTGVLFDYKRAHAAQRLYLGEDTHWTPLGGALALRQLLTALFSPTDALPPPRLSGRDRAYSTDMGNEMLLLWGSEHVAQLDAQVEASLKSVIDAAPPTKTALLHDSFYERLLPTLHGIWPSLTTVDLRTQLGQVSQAVERSDHLIINSVERQFALRFYRTALSWQSPFGKALVARNRKRAESCTDFEPVKISPDLHKSWRGVIEATDGSFVPMLPDPYMIVDVPEGSPAGLACVRVELEVPTRATLEFFLPKKSPQMAFETGRSVQLFLAPGKQTITLVLPEYLKQRWLRIDLGDQPFMPLVVKSLRMGELRVLPPPKAGANVALGSPQEASAISTGTSR